MVRALVGLAMVGASACGPAGGSTLLLLSPEARESGIRFRLRDWSGAPVLPISLGVEETVRAGNETIVLREDALGEVGLGGVVHWRALGTEVRGDAFRVRGSEKAVARLVEILALDRDGVSQVFEDGEATDQWDLEGAGVLQASAWNEVSGLTRLEPMVTEQPGDLAKDIEKALRQLEAPPNPIGTWRLGYRTIVVSSDGTYRSLAKPGAEWISGSWKWNAQDEVLQLIGLAIEPEVFHWWNGTLSTALLGLERVEEDSVSAIFGPIDDEGPVLNGLFGDQRPAFDNVLFRTATP
jgi:hypothetical protein